MHPRGENILSATKSGSHRRLQRLASSQKQEEAEAHYERRHAQRDCDQCLVSLMFQVVLHRLAGMAPALGGQAGAVGDSSIQMHS